MKPLVECVHPKLGPDRIVLMPGGPRNGWRERNVPHKSAKAKAKQANAAGATQTSRQGAGTDSPTAGQSTTITKDEE